MHIGFIPSVNEKAGIPFISLMDPLERGRLFITEGERKKEERRENELKFNG